MYWTILRTSARLFLAGRRCHLVGRNKVSFTWRSIPSYTIVIENPWSAKLKGVDYFVRR